MASRTNCDASIYRRAAVLLGLCAVLAAVASSAALHRAILAVLLASEEIIQAHTYAGAAVFVVVAAVSAMFAFVSIAVLVPAAVFAWNMPASIGLLWLGWILGGLATYATGKFFGRPAVRWLDADEALQRLESRLTAAAPLWTIVLLQLALPSEIPGYLLGLLRYPLARYVIALALAELPYALATVYLGASFVDGRSGVILGTGVAVSLLSVASLLLLRKVMPLREAGKFATTAHPLRSRSVQEKT